MIKYNLICECGKTFESWFSSSSEYDLLKKKKLINCIFCNSVSVKKTIMAPNLQSKSNKLKKFHFKIPGLMTNEIKILIDDNWGDGVI